MSNKHTPISIDFETFYDTASGYGIREMGSTKYIQDMRFDPYLIAVSDGQDSWAGPPRRFNWDSLVGCQPLAHNAGFDSRVYEEMVIRGWAPRIQMEPWLCTASMTTYLCMRRDLKRACEFLLNVELSKETRGYADGKHWPDMIADGKDQEMLAYGRSDALRCAQLYLKFGHLWPQFERDLSALTIRQAHRGIQIDLPRLYRYLEIATRLVQQTEAALPWIAQGKKPMSTKAIAEECRACNIPAKPVKANDGEDAFDEWVVAWRDKFPWVGVYSDYARCKKLRDTLETIRSRCDAAGIFYFDLLYFGAHCMPGETEVLTRTGWVRLDKWKGGRIMQWDINGIRFDDATANEFKGVTESLYSVRTKHTEFCVTAGHWVATKTKTGEIVKRQAVNLFGKRVLIPLSGERVGGTRKFYDEEIRIIVATQADGHFLSDCDGLQFRFTKTRKIERLKRLLNDLGIVFNENVFPSEPDVTVVYVPSPPLWLRNSKTFDANLLTWDRASLETFITEIVHWDGYQCGPNSVEYSTCNHNNAEWVATVAHLTGRSSTIVERSERDPNWATNFRVYIRDYNDTRINGEDWTDLGPAGTVYCPTSKTGICLFRHRGKIFLSGQTGRWSGSGGFNMQNMRKDPYWIDEKGWLITDAPRLSQIEAADEPPQFVTECLDIRSLFIARL